MHTSRRNILRAAILSAGGLALSAGQAAGRDGLLRRVFGGRRRDECCYENTYAAAAIGAVKVNPIVCCVERDDTTGVITKCCIGAEGTARYAAGLGSPTDAYMIVSPAARAVSCCQTITVVCGRQCRTGDEVPGKVEPQPGLGYDVIFDCKDAKCFDGADCNAGYSVKICVVYEFGEICVTQVINPCSWCASNPTKCPDSSSCPPP